MTLKTFHCKFCPDEEAEYYVEDDGIMLCAKCAMIYERGQLHFRDCIITLDEADICEVCGIVINEENRCICEDGHMFCEKHLIHTDDPKFDEEDDMDNVSCSYCPICDKLHYERALKRCS